MAENLPHHTPAAVPMAASEWEGELPGLLRGSFPESHFKSYLDQHWMECALGDIPAVLRYLRDELLFDMLTDVTVVDRPAEPARFEIVYILYSFARNERIRVKTRAADQQDAPSVVSVYAGANWLEREAFDMFGIRFAGHPGLKRILMPEDWNGFPLRKEKSIVAMDNDWVERNLGIESGQ